MTILPRSRRLTGLAIFALCAGTGCWAPLHHHGIPARDLPEEYHMPCRSAAPRLNYADLTVDAPEGYLVSSGDVLEVTVPDLFRGAELRPLRVQVLGNGEVQLPLIGAVKIGGLTLPAARDAINAAYADGIFVDPKVSLIVAQRAAVNVVVLGLVNHPGVYPLARGENDVGHALAAAGGLALDAGDVIEVHRRIPDDAEYRRLLPALPPPPLPDVPGLPEPPGLKEKLAPEYDPQSGEAAPAEVEQAVALVETGMDEACNKMVLEIPLRGPSPRIYTAEGVIERPVALPEDVTLAPGDVVVVPRRVDEVFYVVGPLSSANFVRFSVRDQDREVGGGFLLPPNRDIDVVTAVAMAGYIDPITSPTTVTVHRQTLDGRPLLITVDLIAARYDQRENVYVQPGDIIYLNPDFPWYFRRIFDRIVDDLIRIPYDFGMGRAISP
ncbi:MAG: polysaccharide biosynthesis/export family protein [Planctomycetes bacterium]|nr:polysaccharide biosynthesis/export family protein [Planctomycetota bacterium]